MRVHWVNYNEKAGDRKGTILKHGAGWFRSDNSHNTVAHIEWTVFTKHCFVRAHLGERGDETPVGLSFACWLFAFWFSFDPGVWHKRLLEFFKVDDYEDRELSFSLHDGGLFWNLWTPSMEWSKAKHGRRQGAFHPVDFLFGRTKYSEILIEEGAAEIPMPEGTYKANIKLVEAQWRRSRWPFVWTRVRRATITPMVPIPHPGKGENSWDCDEDATHSLTCSASTIETAIGKMVESVMRSRLRYGGKNWRPAAQKV